MSKAAHKIIEGLKEARAGNLSRVHLFDDDGNRQTWIKQTPLIAAAPDLLASARAFDGMHLTIEAAIRAYDPKNFGVQVKVLQALEANRAAIAKAEGKSE